MVLLYTLLGLAGLALLTAVVLGVGLSPTVFVAYFFAWGLVTLLGWMIWLLVRRLVKRRRIR